jgi:hypothetical protein
LTFRAEHTISPPGKGSPSPIVGIAEGHGFGKAKVTVHAASMVAKAEDFHALE